MHGLFNSSKNIPVPALENLLYFGKGSTLNPDLTIFLKQFIEGNGQPVNDGFNK